MRRTALVIALALAALGARAHADDDPVVPCERAHFDRAIPVSWGAPEIAWEAYADDEGLSVADEYETALAELLSDEVREAGGDVYPVDDGVAVEGDAALALVRRRVTDIDRFVQGRGTFRLAVVHVPNDAAAMSADTVRAAVEAGAGRVLWSSRLVARRGEPVVREEIDETSFVAALDVEVASYASTSEPSQIALLRTGLRIGLWQRPIDADRTHAVLSFHLSQLAGLERIKFASGALDLPSVPFVSWTAPAVLRRGEPRVFAVDHPWEPGVVALVVEALDLPAAPDLPYRLVDVATLTGVGAEPPVVAMGLSEGAWELEEDLPAELSSASDLIDALADADDDLIQLTRTIVAVRPETPVREVAADREITRRVWAMDPVAMASFPGHDPLSGTVARGPSLAALATSTPVVSVRLPVMASGVTSFVSGTWMRVPQGVGVEIADGAAATYPEVVPYVDGDRFEARVLRSGGVRVEAESVRTFSRETRPLVVRRDLEGKRTEDEDDHYVAVRHRRSREADVLTGPGELSVRRLPETVEVGVWDLE